MPAVPLVVVAAVAGNGAIGAAGGLPWRLPADLRRTRALTMGKPLVMGRRTWESIGRPLPGRASVALSRDPAFAPEGATVARDFDEALRIAERLARGMGADEIVAFGGAAIYAAALPLAVRIYMTEIRAAPAGDAFFPPLPPGAWRELSREEHGPGPAGEPAHAFVVLERAGAAPAARLRP